MAVEIVFLCMIFIKYSNKQNLLLIYRIHKNSDYLKKGRMVFLKILLQNKVFTGGAPVLLMNRSDSPGKGCFFFF